MTILKSSYLNLPSDFYEMCKPDSHSNSHLFFFNKKLGSEFSLDLNEDIKSFLSGNIIFQEKPTLALVYAGHQFGHFVPKLGDGRAHILGEVRSKNNILFDLQLKGSGRTSFSRGGDGKATLSAMIKEFLYSEFLNSLSVPTTRSLSIIRTSETVIRDVPQQGAVLCRLAKGHIRVGTFEYFYSRNDMKNLKILAHYVIERNGLETGNYLNFLEWIAKAQARLIAQWMGYGFIHGVMNTDNMSVFGETIDFGPCAFLDEFSFSKTFSSIDREGRYSYENQPSIGLWNIQSLTQCISVLVDNYKTDDLINHISDTYKNEFQKTWFNVMASKFGFFDVDHMSDKNDVLSLIQSFLAYLQNNNLDFTISFYYLNLLFKDIFKNNIDVTQAIDIYFEKLLHIQINYVQNSSPIDPNFKNWFLNWINMHKKNLSFNLEQSFRSMEDSNPVITCRNHIVNKIIEKSKLNNNSDFSNFFKAFQNPRSKDLENTEYFYPPSVTDRVLKTYCGT